MLGNNQDNAEFQHFNRLAAAFGIEFIEKTHRDAKADLKVTIPVPEDSPIFSGPAFFYAVGIAPLKLQASVQRLLSDNGETIMALAKSGKGLVFALGDPWVYNEYIDTKDNRKIATDLFRFLLR
jgi:unsaturated rhamnogalacturonyl hydrolase